MTKTNHAFAHRWLHPLWCGPRFVFPLFLMILCLLTACESNSTREKLPPPPQGTSTRIESPNATESGTNAPLTIAPMPDDTGDGTLAAAAASSQPGTTPIQNGITPAPMGLRADQLFADEVKDPDQRMARLERAVIDMRRELDTNMPAVQRLVTIEGDLQELVRQLQTLMVENNTTPTMGQIQPMGTDSSGDPLNESATVAPQQSGPDVLPPVPPQNMKPEENHDATTPLTIQPPGGEPKTKPTAPAVTTPPKTQDPSPKITDKITPENIRIGRHTDKTRIVIDSTAPLTMTDDMDPIEKLLVLDIEGADITTAQKTPAPNDLIAGIALRNTGPKMGQAVFELKKAVKIQRITTLPPGPNQPNYRTIIDMEK